jgi:hypothetical protein
MNHILVVDVGTCVIQMIPEFIITCQNTPVSITERLPAQTGFTSR